MAELRSKPPVKVERRGTRRVAIAVIEPESIPPLRYEPTGTSLTSWRVTAVDEELGTSSSVASSDEISAGSSGKGKSQ